MSAGRKYLTEREWDAMLEKQDFVCAAIGCESEGPFEADHSTPNAFKAGKPDQLLCEPCHAIKTKRDVKNIAKAKRLAGETSNQFTRREKRKEQGRSFFHGAAKWASRGFTAWRSMSGDIRTKKDKSNG